MTLSRLKITLGKAVLDTTHRLRRFRAVREGNLRYFANVQFYVHNILILEVIGVFLGELHLPTYHLFSKILV